MNPSGHEAFNSRWLKVGRNRFQKYFPHRSQFRHLLGIALCLILVAASLSSINHLQQGQHSFSRLRLLEMSAQNLILQSMALRHLTQPEGNRAAAAETGLKLAAQGYQSAGELLHQMSSRLAIMEALRPEQELAAILTGLRSQLNIMKTQLRTHPELPPSLHMRWWTGIEALHRQVSVNPAGSIQAAISVRHHAQVLSSFLAACGLIAAVYLLMQIRNRSANSAQFKQSGTTGTDDLTGLLNASGWKKMAQTHLKQMKPESQGSLLLLKINHLQQYRDTYGAAAANERLKAFAQLVQSNSRPGDLAARLDDSEFCMLLPDCSLQDAEGLLSRLKKAGNKKLDLSAGACRITPNHDLAYLMAMADMERNLAVDQ